MQQKVFLSIIMMKLTQIQLLFYFQVSHNINKDQF